MSLELLKSKKQFATDSSAKRVASQGLKIERGILKGIGSCTDNDIVVPNGVTSLGGVFCENTSLSSITIPGSVRRIEEFAFCGCKSLKSVTIENGVESIDNNAFVGCTSLTSIEIPNSVSSIGAAFLGCKSLKKVVISASVSNISNLAFSSCVSLEKITVAKGNPVYHSAGNCIIETATGTLIVGCGRSVIPSDGSVKRIETGCFSGSSFERIAIPSSVTYIHWDAFHDCDSLKEIIYSGTITQWSAIKKEHYFFVTRLGFNCFSPYFIHCTDGDIIADRWGNN